MGTAPLNQSTVAEEGPCPRAQVTITMDSAINPTTFDMGGLTRDLLGMAGVEMSLRMWFSFTRTWLDGSER